MLAALIAAVMVWVGVSAIEAPPRDKSHKPQAMLTDARNPQRGQVQAYAYRKGNVIVISYSKPAGNYAAARPTRQFARAKQQRQFAKAKAAQAQQFATVTKTFGHYTVHMGHSPNRYARREKPLGEYASNLGLEQES